MPDLEPQGKGAASGAGAGTAVRPPRDPFRFLMSLAVRHDVAKYRAGTEQAYLVNHPDYIRRVLADNSANYSKATAINSVFKEAVADGLLTSEGALWRKQRRLIQPAFHRERLAALGQEMTDATLQMLEGWDAVAARREPLNVSEQMSSLTLRITARALFGADLTEEAGELGHQIAEGLRLLAAPHKTVVRAATERLERLVGEIIEERSHGKGTHDLLSMLLEARDEETGEPMDPEQLRDEVITLLLAGYETTANAMGWTWFLLDRNPGARDRLDRELAMVLGGRVPTFRDLSRLEYNRMALEESMRLYPPAWILGRRALGDDQLGEQHIPAGSVVAISPYTMHRHPSYWESPDTFDPERFTRERSMAMRPFTYLPFGGGPRRCIGHNFALIEAQLIIATIAQRFRLTLVPGHSVEPERLFVLRPRGGLRMLLQPVAV